jgi:lipopolysaccharide/colanic/teichoic acid biosynthesis glycosyltransferase
MKPCWAESAGKRAFDVTVVGLAGLPALLVVGGGWLAVRLHSGPPGFYRQVRIGRDLKPFSILKLRTMSSGPGGAITVGEDARITTVGRVLRRGKLDELPQLWNVARGEMSLVGPRPEVPEWVTPFREKFEEVLRSRPGLTDLASVIYSDEASVLAAGGDPMAEYRTTVLPRKLALGQLYSAKATLALDLRILALTALAAIWPGPAAHRASRLAERLATPHGQGPGRIGWQSGRGAIGRATDRKVGEFSSLSRPPSSFSWSR